jgi:hypothetical protein
MLGWFGGSWLSPPSGALDGANNARIGAAAANVAVHVGDDLLARRLFVLRQQFRRLHREDTCGRNIRIEALT